MTSMYENDTLYVSLFDAERIITEEKLQFGNRRHIAAKRKILSIRANGKSYERQVVERVRNSLREKYGAKRDERCSGSPQI